MTGVPDRENALFRACIHDFARALSNCSSAFDNLSSGISKLSECITLYGDRVTEAGASNTAARAPPFASLLPFAAAFSGVPAATGPPVVLQPVAPADPTAASAPSISAPPLRAPPARSFAMTDVAAPPAKSRGRSSSRGRGRRTSKATVRPALGNTVPDAEADVPRRKEIVRAAAPAEKRTEHLQATEETEGTQRFIDPVRAIENEFEDDDFDEDIVVHKAPKSKSATTSQRRPTVARKSPKVPARMPASKLTAAPKAVSVSKTASAPKATTSPKSTQSPPTTPKKGKASMIPKKTKSSSAASKTVASKASSAPKAPAAKSVPARQQEPSSPKAPIQSPPARRLHPRKPAREDIRFSFGEAANDDDDDEEMLDAEVSDIESEADGASSVASIDDRDDEDDDDDEDNDDGPIVKLNNFSGRKRSRDTSGSVKTNKSKRGRKRIPVDIDGIDKVLTSIVYNNGTWSNLQIVKEASDNYKDMNVSDNQWRIGVRRLHDNGIFKRIGRKGYIMASNAVGESLRQSAADESPPGTPKKSSGSKQRSKISVRS